MGNVVLDSANSSKVSAWIEYERRELNEKYDNAVCTSADSLENKWYGVSGDAFVRLMDRFAEVMKSTCDGMDAFSQSLSATGGDFEKNDENLSAWDTTEW